MSELPKAYDPRQSEARWYEFWETEGLFTASADPADERKPYAIAIPPFNVTGSLHMGHACRVTFEDALIRYHRMLGHNALWLPGTDHAGIATQVVVERSSRARARAGTTSAVRSSWSACGRGRASPAGGSCSSCACSALRATGRARSSRSTRICRVR